MIEDSISKSFKQNQKLENIIRFIVSSIYALNDLLNPQNCNESYGNKELIKECLNEHIRVYLEMRDENNDNLKINSVDNNDNIKSSEKLTQLFNSLNNQGIEEKRKTISYLLKNKICIKQQINTQQINDFYNQFSSETFCNIIQKEKEDNFGNTFSEIQLLFIEYQLKRFDIIKEVIKLENYNFNNILNILIIDFLNNSESNKLSEVTKKKLIISIIKTIYDKNCISFILGQIPNEIKEKNTYVQIVIELLGSKDEKIVSCVNNLFLPLIREVIHSSDKKLKIDDDIRICFIKNILIIFIPNNEEIIEALLKTYFKSNERNIEFELKNISNIFNILEKYFHNWKDIFSSIEKCKEFINDYKKFIDSLLEIIKFIFPLMYEENFYMLISKIIYNVIFIYNLLNISKDESKKISSSLNEINEINEINQINQKNEILQKNQKQLFEKIDEKIKKLKEKNEKINNQIELIIELDKYNLFNKMNLIIKNEIESIDEINQCKIQELDGEITKLDEEIAKLDEEIKELNEKEMKESINENIEENKKSYEYKARMLLFKNIYTKQLNNKIDDIKKKNNNNITIKISQDQIKQLEKIYTNSNNQETIEKCIEELNEETNKKIYEIKKEIDTESIEIKTLRNQLSASLNKMQDKEIIKECINTANKEIIENNIEELNEIISSLREKYIEKLNKIIPDKIAELIQSQKLDEIINKQYKIYFTVKEKEKDNLSDLEKLKRTIDKTIDNIKNLFIKPKESNKYNIEILDQNQILKNLKEQDMKLFLNKNQKEILKLNENQIIINNLITSQTESKEKLNNNKKKITELLTSIIEEYGKKSTENVKELSLFINDSFNNLLNIFPISILFIGIYFNSLFFKFCQENIIFNYNFITYIFNHYDLEHKERNNKLIKSFEEFISRLISKSVLGEENFEIINDFRTKLIVLGPFVIFNKSTISMLILILKYILKIKDVISDEQKKYLFIYIYIKIKEKKFDFSQIDSNFFNFPNELFDFFISNNNFKIENENIEYNFIVNKNNQLNNNDIDLNNFPLMKILSFLFFADKNDTNQYIKNLETKIKLPLIERPVIPLEKNTSLESIHDHKTLLIFATLNICFIGTLAYFCTKE